MNKQAIPFLCVVVFVGGIILPDGKLIVVGSDNCNSTLLSMTLTYNVNIGSVDFYTYPISGMMPELECNFIPAYYINFSVINQSNYSNSVNGSVMTGKTCYAFLNNGYSLTDIDVTYMLNTSCLNFPQMRTLINYVQN